jgi:hypothetical protein
MKLGLSINILLALLICFRPGAQLKTNNIVYGRWTMCESDFMDKRGVRESTVAFICSTIIFKNDKTGYTNLVGAKDGNPFKWDIKNNRLSIKYTTASTARIDAGTYDITYNRQKKKMILSKPVNNGIVRYILLD